MTNTITKSFTTIITIFRFVGLYPTENHSTLKKIWVYGIFFLQTLLTLLAFVNLLLKGNSDIMAMNQLVVFLAEAVASCFKTLSFLRNGHKIKKCIHYFETPDFAFQTPGEKKIVDECVRICERNVKIYFVALSVAVNSWFVLPIVEQSQKLPIDIWLPYEIDDPAVYYLSYVFVVAVCIYVGYAGEMVEPLITGLAYHATCQLRVLKYNLKNLTELVENPETGFVFEKLKRSVIHHNNILNFISEYEKCFSFSIFCQILASVFALCFCCIGLTMVSLANKYAALYVFTYFILAFQILLYCHCGTLLFEENEKLITDIYTSQWYECDIKIKKNLLVIMERSKKPIILTAGKVINLRYNTFTSILKTSYSMIAVMKS